MGFEVVIASIMGTCLFIGGSLLVLTSVIFLFLFIKEIIKMI